MTDDKTKRPAQATPPAARDAVSLMYRLIEIDFNAAMKAGAM